MKQELENKITEMSRDFLTLQNDLVNKQNNNNNNNCENNSRPNSTAKGIYFLPNFHTFSQSMDLQNFIE